MGTEGGEGAQVSTHQGAPHTVKGVGTGGPAQVQPALSMVRDRVQLSAATHGAVTVHVLTPWPPM